MQLNQQEIVENKQSNLKKSTNLTESKKNFEFVFKLMYLGASIFSATLVHKVYLFQTLPDFDSARKGTVFDMLYYALPFAIFFTVFDLTLHYYFDELCEKYYLTEKKYEGKSRSKRAYTLVKWGYSIIYYFITSVAAYILIKDTSFYPTWLGGNGTCMNQYLNAPHLAEGTFGMKIFYLFQMGKHASRLFSHVFIRQQGNYYEYILHHSLSTFLIIFSFLTNQWLVGIMVLLIHDASDLFLIMARGYKDYKNYSKKILQVIYVFGMLSWIGGRLIILPFCCIKSTLVGSLYIEDSLSIVEKQVLLLVYRWMGLMLVGLLILQVFWTYYIGKAFVEVNVSEKIASNTYQ